jgi:hypothetical protein
MKTTENNKLIAEFMGIIYPKLNNVIVINNEVIKEDDLKYNSSWDWLMPVVTKCLDIYHIEQMNDDLNFKFYDSIGDIKKTYKAVVEFIKFYNENK